MDEVGGAYSPSASRPCLVAVFVPTAFMGGIAGSSKQAVRAHDPRAATMMFARRVAEPDAGVVRARSQTHCRAENRKRRGAWIGQARRVEDGVRGSTGSASAYEVCFVTLRTNRAPG